MLVLKFELFTCIVMIIVYGPSVDNNSVKKFSASSQAWGQVHKYFYLSTVRVFNFEGLNFCG